MTTEQRGYFHAEIVPAFSEGIDRLLVSLDLSPVCWSDSKMKAMLKQGFGVFSTEELNKHQMADFITHIQVLAAECLIYIASPEEWKMGQAEQARADFYDWVLKEF